MLAVREVFLLRGKERGKPTLVGHHLLTKRCSGFMGMELDVIQEGKTSVPAQGRLEALYSGATASICSWSNEPLGDGGSAEAPRRTALS